MSERKETAAPAVGEVNVGANAAAAVALGAFRRGEKQSREAADFLVAHKRLAELQMEHLHEERALHHRHLALKYFGDRLRIGLELLGVIAGLIVLVGLGALIWTAHEDHGLVVEAFSVPPELAQRGLSGQVVASRLLDKLFDMQTQTASARPANSYVNNWGNDLKVEIPTTGVSIGEVRRLLTAWLGHETHISGEVFRTASGLAVAARTGAEPAKTFDGPDADLDTLLQSAAEDVYGATQPYRYAVFLDQHGRSAQARPLLERLARTGAAADRFSASAFLSQKDLYVGDFAGSLAMSRLAMLAKPTSGQGFWLHAVDESILGRPEAALRDFRHAIRLTSRSRGEFTFAKGRVAEYEGNWRAAVVWGAATEAAAAHSGPTEFSANPVFIVFRAADLARDHDISAARAVIAGSGLPEAPGSGLNLGPVAAYRLQRARAAEDWPAILSEMPYFLGDNAGAATSASGGPSVLTTFAYALAKVGRHSDAEALEAKLPDDCYDCVVDRGLIAAMRRDWTTAERWFTEAVRLGPSLPFAYLEWGRMLLAKGDIAGAIDQFELARQKGPHFADPAEMWGEALMRRHDYSGAVEKFETADKDAPHWGRNHMLWGLALAALDKPKEAAGQFQAANGMDLIAADRATLTGLLKSA